MLRCLSMLAAGKSWRVACLLALISVLSAKASAEPFETIINNGAPANRVDIAVLGDGYTAAEMAKYRSDVQQFFQQVFQQEPYKEYRNYFNVHRVDVVSNQSGADHPERTPAVSVDTAFDAGYNCGGIQRLICVNLTKVNNVLANTLAFQQREVVVVIVNDSEYGGSGGAVAVASTHTLAVELVLHETGHSFGLLADEYGDSQGTTCSGSAEPSAPNATKVTDRSLIKWRHWIDPATPVPTSSFTSGVPGLYEGAVYCDRGAYRPTYNSKMRSLGAPFEQVNTEQHVKRIYNFVSPVEDASPSAAQITLQRGQTQNFSVTRPSPLTHELDVTWLVDDQARGTGAAFTLDASALAPGAHTVVASVKDATAMVRNDPENLLSETRLWNVNVSQPLPAVQLASASASFAEGGNAQLSVTRQGDPSAPFTVNYATSDGTASERTDYTGAFGTLSFAAGETSKSVTVFITDDVRVEPDETFTLTLSAPAGADLGAVSSAVVTIRDNDTNPSAPSPVRASNFNSEFFVRQHYRDFLNREPDADGLAFWKNQIDECQNEGCREIRRINVSAAFFLSTEFQETGYLVYKMYQAAYGRRVRNAAPLTFREFLPDVQQVGAGVIVGQGNWQQQLEQNKQAYAAAFVARTLFADRYPSSTTPAQFVEALDANTGNSLTQAERDSLVARLGAGQLTRGAALREVAENAAFTRREKNRAFVLMEYFGYLRRNPYDPPELTLDFAGYDFWLGKLNEFGGNYVNAEMVKAFITSGEYIERFGQ